MPEDKKEDNVIYAPDPYSMGQGQDLPSVLDKTNPDKICEHIRKKFQGYEYNESEEKWVRYADAKPLMNEKGIRSFMTDISAVLNQNTILSNLEDEHISNIIIALGDTIILKLLQRYREYEIDVAELDTILNVVLNLAFCCLRRSWHNLERVFHKATLTEIRHAHSLEGQGQQRPGPQQQQQQKKGFSLLGGL